MPDAVGIADFDYRPSAPGPEVVPEGGEAKEASEDAEATPTIQDLPVVSEGEK
jgi:hypothetical protein